MSHQKFSWCRCKLLLCLQQMENLLFHTQSYSFLSDDVSTVNIKSISLFISTENLSPSELKKLRNKQRKAAKKAQQAQEKQKAEHDKKEQAVKKQGDGEMDGPKEEELLPEKLSRVGVFWALINDATGTSTFSLSHCSYCLEISNLHIQWEILTPSARRSTWTSYPIPKTITDIHQW